MTKNVKRCLALITVGTMAVLAHAQERGRGVPAQQGGAPGRSRGGPGYLQLFDSNMPSIRTISRASGHRTRTGSAAADAVATAAIAATALNSRN